MFLSAGAKPGRTARSLSRSLSAAAQRQSIVLESPVLPQGRLTLTAGVPVVTSDVTAATTIYYTPYVGNSFPLWSTADGCFRRYSAAELSLALDSNSGHTGYHQSTKVMDLVLFSDRGTLRLGTGVAWSSSTSLGTGAGTAEREFINGVWVNKNTMVCRFGSGSADIVTVPAREATIVGSVYFTANGQTEFTIAPTAAAGGTNNKLALCNIYNQRPVMARCRDTTTSWTYGTATIRAANNSASNRITFLNALPEGAVAAEYSCYLVAPASTACFPTIGVGIDSTTVLGGNYATIEHGSATTQNGGTGQANYGGTPGIGLHYVSALEISVGGVANATYLGNLFFLFSAIVWM